MSATAPLALPAPPPVQSDWALFLDVDGCLLDFADEPDAVVVPDGLGDALARLSHVLDGALAFVSGRRILQLDTLFAPLRLPCAGLHGL
ncbi:MAG TPA: trehalose-phosphatase, partial [Lysobacter sp.]